MFMNIERYIELYDRLGIKTKVVNNIVWREYQRMVVPVGPVNFEYVITKEESKFLLEEFSKAIMVRFTYNFDIPQNTEWYALICDYFTDLSELPSFKRSEISRGLKNCIVEMVDADFVSKYGYNVYFLLSKDIKNAKTIGEKEFKQSILSSKNFSDIIHYWCVFEKSSKQLIAYSQNFIYDKIEVNYSTIKFHPDYLKLYPSYALIYTMNKYYLQENGYKYVNDGFRNILHETSIQEYLIRKFNFRMAFTRLKVFYRPYLSITFPFRKYFSKINAKINALYKMEEARILSENGK